MPDPQDMDRLLETVYDDVFVLNMSNVTGHSDAYAEPTTLDLLVPLSIAYAAIFVAGILGNTSTCIVIARNRSMHTATNFYLFSLAISDLILLVCGLPLEFHSLWNPSTYPLGEAPCIIIGLASETSTNATVLTITAFTVERYIAICRPFMSHTMSKLSRAIRFIVAIWVLALCTAAPQAMQFGVEEYVENGQNKSRCTMKDYGVDQVFVISSFVFFVVPMSVISVLYALIGIKLRTSSVLHPVKKLSMESNEKAGHMQYRNGGSQRRVIRMLVAVALSFFICWAPFHVQRLMAIYGNNLKHPSDTFFSVYIMLTNLSGVLYFLSTAINPFLYNIMSNKFRNAFKITLAAWCGRRGGQRMGRTYSALLASQRQRAANTHSERAHGPRRLRRLSTATTQLFDAPPRAQCYKGRDLSVINASSSGNGHWRLRNEPSDSFGSPQSISNSSLREVDDELTGEELATYMYNVNCNIGGLT